MDFNLSLFFKKEQMFVVHLEYKHLCILFIQFFNIVGRF